MSIARQRREGAAALVLLMEDKYRRLQEAASSRDEAATQAAAVEFSMLCQNNAPFMIYVLKRYAGSIKKLPGGLKRDALAHNARHDSTGESLVNAVQADMEGVRT